MNRTMEDIQWRVASDDPLSAAWDREDALGRMLQEDRDYITKLKKQIQELKEQIQEMIE
tara:strand:- start:69 stop:245 length:177 start_codon:yes stop_codon:yes gene_type:complete